MKIARVDIQVIGSMIGGLCGSNFQELIVLISTIEKELVHCLIYIFLNKEEKSVDESAGCLHSLVVNDIQDIKVYPLCAQWKK